MKKTFVLAAMMAFAAVAHAETFKVHIPVAYATTGSMLPAGEYAVSSVNGSGSIFLFQSADTKVFVFGRMIRSAADKPLHMEIDKDKTLGLRASAQAFALSPAKKK